MAHKFQGGKLHAQPGRKQLRFSKTLADLPAAPESIDWETEVTDWPMYLNDQIGDCTFAEVGHQIEQFTRYGTGTTVQVTENDLLKGYEKVSGYKPGRPATDTGCYVQDVLTYWRKTGVGGHKIVAFASLDVSNFEEIKQAIYLFGSIDIGLQFPDSAMEQFDNGEDWDVVKGANHEGGHCVMGGAYTADNKIGIVTWGATAYLTEAFWNKYVDEAWIVLDEEGLNKAGQYFSGSVSFYELGQEFEALTGEPNPIPQPVDPAPTPSPEPTPDPVPAPEDADTNLAVAFDAWLSAKGL